MRVKYLLKSVPFYGALLGMVAIYLGDDYFKVHLAQLDMGFLIAILLLCIWILFKAAGAGNEFKWLNNAPSIITTVGIFCTFVGVTIGLLGYNPANPDLSNLLAGLKIAFIPSAYAIFCSIFFKWSAISIEPDDEQVLSQLSTLLENIESKIEGLQKDIELNGVKKLGDSIAIPDLPENVKEFIELMRIVQEPIQVKFDLSSNGQKIDMDLIGKLNKLEDKTVQVLVNGLDESLGKLNSVNDKIVQVSVNGLDESLEKLNKVNDKTVQVSVNGLDESLDKLNSVNNKTVQVSVNGLDESLEKLNMVNDKTIQVTLDTKDYEEKIMELNRIANKTITILSEEDVQSNLRNVLSAKITGELDLDDARKTFESYLTNKAGFANPDSYLAAISENLDALKLIWVNNNG